MLAYFFLHLNNEHRFKINYSENLGFTYFYKLTNCQREDNNKTIVWNANIFIFIRFNDFSLEIIESIEDTANSRAAFQALIKDPKYNISDSFDSNIPERYFINYISVKWMIILILIICFRRIDSNPEDAICQSKVTMARPKKARSTNGQWKYVVNTDEYVQTLRLEKCSWVHRKYIKTRLCTCVLQ